MFFIGCTSEPINGYCVGKKKTEGHMSDKTANSVKYSIVIVPHVPARRASPRWIKTEYEIAVANYDEFKHIRVDSVTFFRTQVGKKYTFKY